MSRSSASEAASTPDRMHDLDCPGRRDRAQTEPLAALAAVLAVGVAVSLYAGAIPHFGERPDRVAETTLNSVHDHATRAGVVIPSRLDGTTELGPPGYTVNVTLSAAGFDWSRGPPRPPASTNATRPVSVRTSDYDAAVGRLSVGVWT